MAKKILSDDEARALAAQLVDLVRNTDIAKGGCNVCGQPGHLAGHHDDPAGLPTSGEAS